jgi:hypothetical protein
MRGLKSRAEGIDKKGTNLTALLRLLTERRQRRALRRIARMLVALENAAAPPLARTPSQRMTLGPR